MIFIYYDSQYLEIKKIMQLAIDCRNKSASFLVSLRQQWHIAVRLPYFNFSKDCLENQHSLVPISFEYTQINMSRTELWTDVSFKEKKVALNIQS